MSRLPLIAGQAAALVMSVAALCLHAQGDPPRSTAQVTAPPAGAAPGRAAGTVVRVTGAGARPVIGRWVVLHRIGSIPGASDSVGGAAIDSARTDGRGRFTFTYPRRADDSARFFVSTSHHGIAYISAALPPDARDETASMSVFDTTSAPGAFAVQGRHVLIFAADSAGEHRAAEVYTLSNDTIVTRIAGASGTPVWTAVIPAVARDLVPGPESAAAGDVIRVVDGRAAMFSAIAPGFKRIDFAYRLPASAFPVSIPIDAPTPVLEVLVESAGGAATGAGLVEVSPMSIEGKNFRRFQALDVAGASVTTIDLAAGGEPRGAPAGAIAAGMAAVMAAALIVASRRRHGARAPRAAPAPIAPVDRPVSPDAETDALARRIAELDAEFAGHPAQSDDSRLRYEETRAQLKRRLAERLAARAGR